ncbi:MAG: tyrosine-type recombinase/integrase [Deltaproteobacteria bacterium]|nr:tyrosine-type recombinase/integrase [Deltaproteobacteria bacterium]
MSRTFAELLDQYELYARARGFSGEQVDLTRLSVSLFAQFLETSGDAQDVTGDDYRRFVVDLRSRRARHGSGKESEHYLSGTTVHTYGRVVKTFFAWLSEARIIAENPLAGIPAPRKPKTIPKVYREKELLAVSAAVTSVRDRAIYELFLDSGIRLKELSTIKIGDIDIEEGSVRVMGKGGKERFVPFIPPVAESIKAYVKESRRDAAKNDALFVTSTGSPLKTRGIQTMLYRLGERAGLKERLSPHKLRHTFATLSLKNGGNLEYIRKILGHTDIKTTSDAYLNVLDEDVKAAHRKFSPLANLKTAGAGKGFVSPNEGKPADQQKNPEMPLRNSKQESPPKLAHDRSPGEHEKTEAGERLDKAHAGLRPNYQDLYREYLRKLADLTGELIADIENGNLEPPRRPSKTNPKSMFGGLGLVRVYHAQNKPLWPFLLQHLDNEFSNTPLTAQIARVGLASLLARFLKKESEERDLADAVREKLVLVSERATFAGTCKICQGYFDNGGNK